MSDPLQGQILLVDDDSDIRSAVGQTLDLAGYSVITAASAQEALQLLTHPWKGIVICDVRMPGCSGLELLTALMQIDADIPVVMLTGHGDIPMAVGAINRGAYDFLEKTLPVRPATRCSSPRHGKTQSGIGKPATEIHTRRLNLWNGIANSGRFRGN